MEPSKLSISTNADQYSKIENKELKGTSISLATIKIADLGRLSKAKIWVIEKVLGKTYVQLSIDKEEQGSVLCKVTDLAKKLGVSKEKVLQAESERTIHDLIALSLEAKHQHTPISVMRSFIQAKGIERLHYLEYLGESLHIPLPELIEADTQGKINEVLENAQKISENDIEDVLMSLPSAKTGSLPKDTIEKIFIAGRKQGSVLEAELKETISDLGLGINDFSEEELKRLVTTMLISRNIRLYRTAEAAENIVYEKLLNLSLSQYKDEPDYPSEAEAYCSELFKEFGMKEPVDPDLRDKMYLRSKLANHNSIVARNLDEEISKPLLSQFESLCEELKQPDSLSDTEIEKKALATMAILNFLSKGIPVDKANEYLWTELLEKFSVTLKIKLTTENKSVRESLSKAFNHFDFFVEDGIIAYWLQEGGGSREDVTQMIYGRTKKEQEKIKTQNRAAVAEKLQDFAQEIKKRESISIEMLCTLHVVNNQKITPAHTALLRSKEDEIITFGKRVGVMPKNVEPAVQDVLNRANRLIQKPPGRPFAKLKWSIEVAKLHNELLDIHPFMDRNGSTSLLFMELMMAAHGDYNPPKERIRDYNANISGILGNSLAVAIVNYEHYKIAHRIGHYKTKFLKADKEATAFYEKQIRLQRLQSKLT